MLAVALGFLVFTPAQALGLIRHGGYWLMALTVALFVASLVRYLRARWKAHGVRRVDWVIPGLAALVTALLLIHEPFGFKVLMDELVLSATSMSLHLYREVFTPLRTHNFDGAYIVTGGIVDKRPYFFQFVLSVLHDLTGFRPGNVFLLNGLLTFTFFCLVGHFVSKVVNPVAGRLSILLLAGLPLLALNATGGGFEILNLVMILLTMTAAVSYLEDHDGRSLNLMILSGVLLAQTRYESVIYLLPVGLVVAIGWLRQRRIQLTWPVLVAPLLLIPYPLINSVFNAYNGFWQLPENVDSPFGMGFLADNLSHAVAYLYGTSPLQSNSAFLSFAGTIGVVFLIILLVRNLVKREALPPALIVVTLFGAVILGTFCILMFYHWGRLDDYVVSRLSLPLSLLFAMAIPIALVDFKPTAKVWSGFVILAAAYAVTIAIPSSARAYATETSFAYRQTKWFSEFIKQHQDEGAFFIVPSPLIAVVHRQPGITNSLADIRAAQLKYHLDHGTYSNAYVFQVLVDGGGPDLLTVHEESILNEEEFVLETLAERKFVPRYRSRISRVLEIRPGPAEDRVEDPLGLHLLELNRKKTGDAEVDLSMQEFLDNLP